MNIIVNKNISKKAFVIITFGAILIGIVMIYIATKGFINVNILKNYKKEIAEIYYSEIDDTDSMGQKMSSTVRVIKYNYFVDNKQYIGQDKLWYKRTDKNVNIGDKIEIYYNINNPSKSEAYHISYISILLAICFIVFPLLLLKQKIKED